MVAFIVYASTFLGMLGLSFFPVRGPRDPRRAAALAFAALALTLAGCTRFAMTGEGWLFGLWVGAAYNVSAIVATGLDPLQATGEWDGDGPGPTSTDDGVGARRYRLWPTVLLFAVLGLGTWIWRDTLTALAAGA